MSTPDRSVPFLANAKQGESRSLPSGAKGQLNTPLKQKECLQECLQLKRGLTSSEKNCIIVCYQKSGLPRRKGL
jgi:hypothetical protein